MAFLYGLETDGEKSISLIRRGAFHRSALLRFACLQKASLRQETRAAKLTRALLEFNSVGDHDPFSFSFPWFISRRLVSAKTQRQANVGDGNRLPFLFVLSSLPCLSSALWHPWMLLFVSLVAFTAHFCATEAESALRHKEPADLCPPREASPPLNVLCPRSESCAWQITAPIRYLRHHRPPHNSHPPTQGHRRGHSCCCRLSPACVSCGTPWRFLGGRAVESPPEPAAKGAAAS